MKAITIEELRKLLRARADRAGSERILATKLGISFSYMNDIINGKRNPGPKILRALSLREERVYIRS